MSAAPEALPTPAYLYLRLSSADGPDSESNSIQNQRALLTRWAQENHFSVVREFVDDGHTGTDFERPGFQALSACLLQGGVRCLIVKDLSRLGRNYAETGRYLEEVFPKLGVRFIAVNDGYDSASNTLSTAQMAVFKNVFNDWYAQEASAKVRASLQVLKKQGKFLGGTAPYGYRIDPGDRYHLLPDGRTAPVVRRIYRQFLSGKTCAGIARELSREGIATPSARHPRREGGRNITGLWSAETVRAILRHPVYQGDMAQQWTRAVSYKVHQRRRVPPEERIVVRDTHEALVTRAEFAQAQDLLKVRSYGDTGHPHLLTGIAFCADCGSPMYAKKRGAYWYLNCYGYYRDPALHRCTSHSIREDAVVEAVLRALRREAERSVDVPALAQALSARKDCKDDISNRLQHLRRCRERTREARLAAYRDRAAGVLREEEFRYIFETLRGEETAVQEQIDVLEQEERARQNGTDIEAALHRFLRFDRLNKAQLHQLVRRVEIDEEKGITILFAFRRGPDAPAPGRHIDKRRNIEYT